MNPEQKFSNFSAVFSNEWAPTTVVLPTCSQTKIIFPTQTRAKKRTNHLILPSICIKYGKLPKRLEFSLTPCYTPWNNNGYHLNPLGLEDVFFGGSWPRVTTLLLHWGPKLHGIGTQKSLSANLRSPKRSSKPTSDILIGLHLHEMLGKKFQNIIPNGGLMVMNPMVQSKKILKQSK